MRVFGVKPNRILQHHLSFGGKVVTDFEDVQEPTEEDKSKKKKRNWKRRFRWGGLLGLIGGFFFPAQGTIQRSIEHHSGSNPPYQKADLQTVPKTKKLSLHVPQNKSGQSNDCGTQTMVASVNSAHGKRHVTADQIDDRVRKLDIFMTPEAMAHTARKMGVEAEIYNNSSYKELVHHLDKGHGIVALVKNVHYIAILGYDHTKGKKRVWVFDPSRPSFTVKSSKKKVGGIAWIVHEKIPYKGHWMDFDTLDNRWKDFQVRVGGTMDLSLSVGTQKIQKKLGKVVKVSTGHNRLIIVFKKRGNSLVTEGQETLPPSRYGYNVSTTLAGNLANTINAYMAISSKDFEKLGEEDHLRGFAILMSGIFFLTSFLPYKTMGKGYKMLRDAAKASVRGDIIF